MSLSRRFDHLLLSLTYIESNSIRICVTLASGGFISLFSFQREVGQSYTNTEVDAIAQVKNTGD